ncbi:macrophage mannose receptor 1-like isoform X1 [Haliotis rubra]|uniref:macrophage mannose receptor 1-like isoform X1 n=1 Tax=Haliotis rubra TaxID=36100 RepID=UPI001EE607F6|nr:macrophage mannose receptor 1-like isoform X1 [Haliotis rubra]XP_046578897.1 macrophage mannose receptor 1-like isoform X1 [Haliotis rubra]
MVLFPGILLSCLFISAFAEEDDFSKCPSAIPRNQYLRTFRNRCYEFVVFHEAYWPDANAQCRSTGGSLVSVNDAETQQFLVSTLVRLNFAKHGIWIGLNDQKVESTYEWASGDKVTYTDWATGEPNFAHGVEDCVLMKSTKAYTWEDHPCHLWPQHYSYICEYEMFQSTTPPANAATGQSAMAMN